MLKDKVVALGKKVVEKAKKGVAAVALAVTAVSLKASTSFATEVGETAKVSDVMSEEVKTGISGGFSDLMTMLLELIGMLLPVVIVAIFVFIAFKLILKAVKTAAAKIG